MRANQFKPIIIRTQHGAALLIMIVIMVVGIATILITSLSSSALNSARLDKTAASLVQAKEALIGRAVKDANRPGSLPCPDTTGSGSADLLSGNHCPKYVGRLPWKTLGLPDLRDGHGEGLWYALSPSVRDDNSAQPINSETQGQFTVTGGNSISNVVAIIFSPGPVLSALSQSRISANQNSVSSYLEGSNATNAGTINTDVANSTFSGASYAFVSGTSSDTFNDQLLAIAHDQLFQPVEMRIAREVRSCLDTYAVSSGNTYPWAVPIADTTYTSTAGTYFGRIAEPIVTQTQLDTALENAGSYVVSQKNTLPGLHDEMLYAGTWAIELATNGLHLVSGVQVKLDIALTDAQMYPASPSKSIVMAALNDLQSALNNYASGPTSCAIPFSAPYWSSWQAQVFYQVANGFQPGGPASCSGPNCITTNTTGTYRAAVLVARSPINGQTRNFPAVSTYLEPPNDHVNSGLTTNFQTYSIGDPSFSNTNDLVLCLDGAVDCK